MPNLVELIKKAALEAVQDSAPAAVVFGTVVSTAPLTVDIEQRLRISAPHLVIPGGSESGLSPGNKVTLLRAQGGQKFILLNGRGADGLNGREIELQKSATHIQWRYAGDAEWTNLVALSEITGDPGADGQEIELQTTETHIQWRHIGGAWANLVALSDITGPPGSPGIGVATGGLAGQTLQKASATDYDTAWGPEPLPLDGSKAMTGPLLIPENVDVTLTSVGHPLQLGVSSGLNIAMDSNEIQARNNGQIAQLHLNNLGGTVRINEAVGGGTAWHEGNLPVEYGTWTPTLAGQTTAGSYSYSTRAGFYFRIGRYIYITCRIQLTTPITAGSGYMMITGLPFTSMNTTGAYWSGPAVLAGVSGWTQNYVSAFIDPNTSYVRFYGSSSQSGGSGFIAVTTAVNGNVINFSIGYLTN